MADRVKLRAMLAEEPRGPWSVTSLQVHRQGFQAYVKTPARALNYDTADNLAALMEAMWNELPGLLDELDRAEALAQERLERCQRLEEALREAQARIRELQEAPRG